MSILEGNRIIYKVIKFWFISIFILIVTGCQILSVQGPEERRKEEILNTQKSVVVNLLNKGLPELALKDLRQHIAQNPDDADFKNLMGLAMLALRNHQEAIKYLTEAYKLNPRPSFALNLSSAYIEAGQFDKSIALLIKLNKDKVMETYPHPERISHNLGFASERAKNFKQAERYYLKALGQNPMFYNSLMRLGSIYERGKQPKKAFTYFAKAKKSCPSCFDPINALAINYLSIGQKQKAVKLVQNYLSLKELQPQDRVRGTKLLEMTKKAANPSARRQ